MPRKKSKNIITVAITLLFVLSIGYFAVLPPTSAWFYQKYDGVQKDFIFGSLSVQSDYVVSADVDLLAATKLEDDEEILFDEVLYTATVNAVNDGTLPARVYLTVTQNSGNPAGLRYFFYENADTGAKVRDKIAGKGIITPGDDDATYAALDLYHTGDGVNNNYGRYIIIPPGVPKTLSVAFWADYNVVGSTLENTGIVGEHFTYNDVIITLSGVQDTDGAFTRP